MSSFPLALFTILLICHFTTSVSVIETNEDEPGFQLASYTPMTLDRALQILFPSATSRASTNDVIDDLVVPKGDIPAKFFWSGFGVKNSAEIAAEIAHYYNGVTLEMLLQRKENVAINKTICKWPSKEDESPIAEACRTQWRELSMTYADKTRGLAVPILGNKVTSHSVWMTYEKNTLEDSQRKGRIVYGFQHSMDLYEVFCVKMRDYRTDYPAIKKQLCSKKST